MRRRDVLVAVVADHDHRLLLLVCQMLAVESC